MKLSDAPTILIDKNQLCNSKMSVLILASDVDADNAQGRRGRARSGALAFAGARRPRALSIECK